MQSLGRHAREWHRSKTPMKLIVRISLLVSLLICTVSCATRPASGSASEVATAMSLSDLAAGHYVAHRAWPQNRAQLEQRWNKMVYLSHGELAPEKSWELAAFFSRFTLLELQPSGPDLMVHYRVASGRKSADHTLHLKPGPTVDAILQTAVVR